MKKIFQSFRFFFLLALVGLGACMGEAPQISGIAATTNFDTIACVPQTKTIQIRNNNTDEPQRVQGVGFELGTNQFNVVDGEKPNPKLPDWMKKEQQFIPYYKIEDVTANGKTHKQVADWNEEILLPPGGIMEVRVTYNPKATTSGDARHYTYLDFVLNGPKVGVMQIELAGKAEQKLEGCAADAGGGQVFQVTALETVISHKDLASTTPTTLDPATAVDGDFEFGIDEAGGIITLPTTGWPTITIPLPAPINGLTSLPITLAEDAEGTFNAGEILFDKSVTVKVAGIINLPGVTMSTGTINITDAEAPNVAGGSFTITGAKLENGEMTLVVAAPLKTPGGTSQLDTSTVAGGVFGAKLTLKKK